MNILGGFFLGVVFMSLRGSAPPPAPPPVAVPVTQLDTPTPKYLPCPACPGPELLGDEGVYQAFNGTLATKEDHCYSWMYADVLGRFHCRGSLAHVSRGGQQLRLLEVL